MNEYEVYLYDELLGIFPGIGAATTFVKALFLESHDCDKPLKVTVKRKIYQEDHNNDVSA